MNIEKCWTLLLTWPAWVQVWLRTDFEHWRNCKTALKVWIVDVLCIVQIVCVLQVVCIVRILYIVCMVVVVCIVLYLNTASVYWAGFVTHKIPHTKLYPSREKVANMVAVAQEFWLGWPRMCSLDTTTLAMVWIYFVFFWCNPCPDTTKSFDLANPGCLLLPWCEYICVDSNYIYVWRGKENLFFCNTIRLCSFNYNQILFLDKRN